MKERVEEILTYLRISSAQFADSINVQRSSISHILSGRNKPSFDFIHKILLKYPAINADWLLTGRGSMLNTNTSQSNMPAVDHEKSSSPGLFNQFKPKQTEKPDNELLKPKADTSKEQDTQISKVTNVNKVKQIIYIYEDGTFQILNPRE